MTNHSKVTEMLWNFHGDSMVNPHRLLATYRMEIKHMSPIKPGDISAFKKLFNFLTDCQFISKTDVTGTI